MKYFFRVLLTDRRDFLLQNKAIYDKFRDFAWNRSPTPVHVLHTRKNSINKTSNCIGRRFKKTMWFEFVFVFGIQQALI